MDKEKVKFEVADMKCLKCGRKWIMRTYKQNDYINIDYENYCGCGTKLQSRKEHD